MAKVYYARLPEDWRKERKYQFLEEKQHIFNVEWQEITPDAKHNWLTEALQNDFDSFLPLGSKDAKASKNLEVETIFKTYGLGVSTNRDSWVYNFDEDDLKNNIKQTVEFYNEQVFKWIHSDKQIDVNDFVDYDAKKISWSRDLKADLKRGKTLAFHLNKTQTALYRPFVRKSIYFDRSLVDQVSIFPSIFPTSETENQVICLSDIGHRSAFACLCADTVADLHLCASSDGFECFPFYVYSEDGANRRKNITDWALHKFREHYGAGVHPTGAAGDEVLKPRLLVDQLRGLKKSAEIGQRQITKRDIFYYVYAVLHHPLYREKYAANLKRELPRVPLVPDFWAFADAGEELAQLHVNHDNRPAFPLEQIESKAEEFTLRVEKMRLSKDKTELRYNSFLTLAGIPPETFEYRLGNRSALEWVIEQYQVTTDARSGITNDPNRADDPQYILRLVGQIVAVSLETVRLVKGLARLELTA